MSKPVVHVITGPNGKAACGVIHVYNNVCGFRNGVTCVKCKKTAAYKALPFVHRAKP